MKRCSWCQFDDVPDEENQHPDEEIGGRDFVTGAWICNNCKLVALEQEEISAII